jgi:hypothetical protein
LVIGFQEEHMNRFTAIALTATAAIAAAVTATAASASDRLSDVDYIRANRCRALVASSELGGQDATAFDALIKEQSRGRAPYIMSKGEDAQDSAKRAIKSGDDLRKQRLVAERDGATCQAFTGGTSLTASTAPASRTN